MNKKFPFIKLYLFVISFNFDLAYTKLTKHINSIGKKSVIFKLCLKQRINKQNDIEIKLIYTCVPSVVLTAIYFVQYYKVSN